MSENDTGRDFVVIRHPVTEQTVTVRRHVFEAVWRKRDWQEVAEDGEMIPNPEPPPEPVDTPETNTDETEEL